MKFTFSWLKKYLDTKHSVEDIAQKLSTIGLEVDNVVDYSKIYSPFLIAEIKSTIPHPEADKLKICEVFDGQQLLQIICGAANARAGIKVVLAPIGAIIPKSQLKIKAAKIRGIKSNGMMCSAGELNLENDDHDHDGIIELSADAVIGEKYSTYAGLSDIVIDIDITPNRGDCTYVYGIARDLVATGIGKLKKPELLELNPSSIKNPYNINIIDQPGCYEFVTCYIEGVNNHSVIDNGKLMQLCNYDTKIPLINISNFAMFDFGRPNHIYDADKIIGEIYVRKAKNGEKFLAIGKKEYTLSDDITVIADTEKILAIAGIIGGEECKVTNDTKNIIVEIANFAVDTTIMSGRKLNLHTDSSFRFERRIDFANTDFFTNYLIGMITQNCGGKISNIIKVCRNSTQYIQHIPFVYSSIAKLTGCYIEEDLAYKILQDLGFIYDNDNNIVTVPAWRQGDVVGSADIIEEIIRINGIKNITPTPLPPWQMQLQSTNHIIAENLIARGLYESVNWSFYNPDDQENFGNTDAIILANPISSDMSVMRQTIIVHLLKASARNISRGDTNIALFEQGAIFDHNFVNKQNESVAGVRIGQAIYDTVHIKGREVDFFDIKGDIFAILIAKGLNPDTIKLDRDVPSYYHPRKSARFLIGHKVIAYAGQIHPTINKKYDIEKAAYCFELFLDRLPHVKIKDSKKTLKLSQYQASKRDFAFIIDDSIAVGGIQKSVHSIDKNIIKSVNIFDIYKGKEIAADKKSVAISVKMQSDTTTLIDAQIIAISEKIIYKLVKNYNAQMR